MAGITQNKQECLIFIMVSSKMHEWSEEGKNLLDQIQKEANSIKK